MRPVGAGCSAHHLAADLLAIFGIDRSSLLTSDGSLDSYSVATDHDQMSTSMPGISGCPFGLLGPVERRQQFEEELRLAAR